MKYYLLLLLILVGCSSSGLIDDSKINDSIELTLAVSSTADSVLSDTILMFTDRADKLSDGKIKISVKNYDNPLNQLNLSAQLCIVEDSQAIEKAKELEFLHMPFMFESSDEYLAFLGGRKSNSAIGKIFYGKLNAELLGIYMYQTVYLISSESFNKDLSLFDSIGVLSSALDNKIYNVLGFIIKSVDLEKDLMELFSSDNVKHMEIYTTTEVSDSALAKAFSIGLTEHRYTSHFLLLGKDYKLDTHTQMILQQAYAETLYQHTAKRRSLWENYYIDLLNRRRIQVHTIGEFSPARRLCNINFLRYYDDLGISELVWRELKELVVLS